MKKILTSFALIVAAGMFLSAQNIPQAAKDKAADLVSKMTLRLSVKDDMIAEDENFDQIVKAA